MAKHQDVYLKGREAARDGKKRDENPFGSQSARHDWFEGWDEWQLDAASATDFARQTKPATPSKGS